MRRRQDLIVPIRDRRKRKRILTLKNFAIVMGVLLIAFLAISIRSEMRSFAPGAYGRLFRRELPPVPEQTKPMEIVHEGPPPVDNAPPIFIEPIAPPEPAPPTVTMTDGSGVGIAGGPEGVTIVRRDRRKPELSGGFGR